jgi:hypothetical protein
MILYLRAQRHHLKTFRPCAHFRKRRIQNLHTNPIAPLHTNNEHAEKEIRKQSHLQQPQKKKSPLMINLSKTVKDLYNGNYKTLKKLRKILEDGKTCHVHGLAELIW